MSKPKRIQRKRTKGWRMPENCVCVTRPGKWGNPFRVNQNDDGTWSVVACDGTVAIPKATREDAGRGAVRLFRAYLANDGSQPGAIRDSGGAALAAFAKEELRGKDLACFCPIGQPCHADVLLELANKET